MSKQKNIDIVQDFLIDSPKYIRKHFKKMKKAYKNKKVYKKGLVVYKYICCNTMCHSPKRQKEILNAIEKIFSSII
jgi:hypothetical protein